MSTINPLIIRTALPFGYLIAYALLLGLGVLGVGLLATGVKRRAGVRAAGGAFVLAFTVYVVVVNIREEGALDMNPQIGNGSLLVGKWRNASGATLTLAADGTYRCVGAGECNVLMPSGAWRVTQESDDIEMRPSSAATAPTIYSIVSYRGHLRLAHQIHDPDTWDEEMPFEYVAPVS
jgi:hypothetical protein